MKNVVVEVCLLFLLYEQQCSVQVFQNRSHCQAANGSCVVSF